MTHKRTAQLSKINKSAKQFKQQYPNVDKAMKLYSSSSDVKKQAQVAKTYKTTTSTSLSGIFTTR